MGRFVSWQLQAASQNLVGLPLSSIPLHSQCSIRPRILTSTEEDELVATMRLARTRGAPLDRETVSLMASRIVAVQRPAAEPVELRVVCFQPPPPLPHPPAGLGHQSEEAPQVEQPEAGDDRSAAPYPSWP